jgi:hypothetical protein
MAQHDILVRSLKKVAEDAEDENGGWKIPLTIFVRGTSGSVQAQTLNDNLKELQVMSRRCRDEAFQGLEIFE